MLQVQRAWPSWPAPRRGFLASSLAAVLAALRVFSLLAGFGVALTCTDGEAEAKPKLSATQVDARNTQTLASIVPTTGEPKWEYIVLHHTAGETDSLQGISTWHKRRFRDWLGIQYHFLIGNGPSAPDGLIQIARWQHHVESMHVAHPERAPLAITISLQGNLHNHQPSPSQMLAVERLVRHLGRLYHLDTSRLSTNTRVDGTVTVCPGKHFPIDRLLWRLDHVQDVTLADWRRPLEPVPMRGPFASLDALQSSLRWQRGCPKSEVPVTATELGRLVPGEGVRLAQLMAIDGGRVCVRIQRRFLLLHTAQGLFATELNGYRQSRLSLQRGQVEVADERGPMQRCGLAGDATVPTCQLY